MSLDMSPSAAFDDATDRRPIDAVMNGNGFVSAFPGSIGAAYFKYLRLGELSRRAVCPYAVICSALSYLVSHVVKRTAKEQVTRIHAGGIVTPMADERAIRNRADMQFITEPMGPYVLPLYVHHAVTVGSRPCPIPTLVFALLCDVTPKAIFRVLHSPSVVALLPAKQARTALHVAREKLKALAASMASNIYQISGVHILIIPPMQQVKI